ncbi:DUF5996 family protein [Pararhizobium sp. LjRoot255]|uniref:DUF5996 family protein n=1 Tax=Pararhizobium sp. LjRoot255 TaxID=3342298 RepID=UPI003ED09731
MTAPPAHSSASSSLRAAAAFRSRRSSPSDPLNRTSSFEDSSVKRSAVPRVVCRNRNQASPRALATRRCARLRPSTTRALGSSSLPCDAVRRSPNPDEFLLGFLQETYEAAANLGKWDRQTLERHWV